MSSKSVQATLQDWSKGNGIAFVRAMFRCVVGPVIALGRFELELER